MEAKAQLYVPVCLRSFQRFNMVDIKEFVGERKMQLILEKTDEVIHTCNCCGGVQGAYHSKYRAVARHMRMMGWDVSINFFREKR